MIFCFIFAACFGNGAQNGFSTRKKRFCIMDIATLYKHFMECTSVTTDSRNCPKGSMFIALKGENFNGNKFAEQALERGCQYAVVDEPDAVNANPRIILVDDCLKTLQALAQCHRRKMGTRIIAITGTNGKTTTKELVAAVLSKRYEVLYTQGNLNNHIGVPLTLLRLTEEHEVAVIEMGANHPGEIHQLVTIAEPDYGLITNVGMAHLEGFGSLDGVIRTKGELYDYLRYAGKHVVFIDKDNEYLKGISQNLTRIGYSDHQTEGLYVSGHLTGCSPYLAFEWEHDGRHSEVETHLIGAYNLKNALAAITVGCFFSVPARSISEAIAEYIPTNNRSQLTETPTNHLVVDAYNANPTSMQAALENFRLMEVPHKVAILGDMKELGRKSLAEHRKVIDQIKACDFEQVYLVGPEFGRVTKDYVHFKDVESLKKAWTDEKPEGCYILIKGSNSMHLSTLKDFL
jgi:UDP-N-acetylmuramoyl-tripeptide--D-alanyl-D-alanine ligase